MSSKAWNSLMKLLAEDLDPHKKHGRKAEFCRITGFSRATVDRWLAGQNVPGIDDLEKISAWFKRQPWELIKPEHALYTASPTEEQLLSMIKERDKKIRDLEEEPLKTEDSDLFARFIKAWQRLDHNQRKSITGSAEARANDLPESNESIEKKRKA